MTTDRSALITGLAGPELLPDEAQFLRETCPAGVILFARNCQTHDQIRALITAAKLAAGTSDILVLIDQEGGRVQRLRPPLGRALPPAAVYAARHASNPETARASARAVARLVAAELRDLGIDTNCAPVADVPAPGSHDIIGDRAYGRDPETIIALAREVANGLMDGGVLPVIKHIPGHGRAMADSHFDLPVVDAPHAELSLIDFKPFKALAEIPAAMTAHVVFTALDKDNPASTSGIVTREIIRGEIGFDGLLISDDLSMKALSGSMRSRAEAVIAAGSDVALHCNGDINEMRDAAAGVPRLTGRALDRFARALAVTRTIAPFDIAAAEQELAQLVAA